jgi:para-nitrobenzyl esterase
VTTENPAIYTFNGLPFAEAPIGDLRWAAPQKPNSWTEVRSAANFGNRCMQPLSTEDGFMNRLIEGQGLNPLKTALIKRVIKSAKPAPISEDCLYLNVRTGNLNTETKQPVMVWIHGGGHQFGSADTSFYQANGLAEKGVVLVTINYRLGVFGYMAHPALSATDPNGVSGNYGTLDQIAALKWVQDNISAYGGDPENITIFGESAGAWSVTELMASPLAKGLFHKAIGQSGSSTYHLGQMSGGIEGWPSGYSVGEKVALSVGLDNPTAAELRAVPAEKIIANLPEKSDDAFHHIRDGYVFPLNVGHAFEDGAINAVPFMTGFNADEATLFFPDDPEPSVWIEGLPRTDIEAQKAQLEEAYPGQGALLQQLYGLTENFTKGGTDMMGDDIFGVNIRFAAEKNAALGQPSYAYHFTRIPPSETQTIRAYHAAEIPFVFDSVEAALGLSEEDEALTNLMGTYWTNFAKTGDPTLPIDVPSLWPEYNNREWMVFSANVNSPLTQVQQDIREQKLDALETGLRKKLDELRLVTAEKN